MGAFFLENTSEFLFISVGMIMLTGSIFKSMFKDFYNSEKIIVESKEESSFHNPNGVIILPRLSMISSIIVNDDEVGIIRNSNKFGVIQKIFLYGLLSLQWIMLILAMCSFGLIAYFIFLRAYAFTLPSHVLDYYPSAIGLLSDIATIFIIFKLNSYDRLMRKAQRAIDALRRHGDKSE